VTALAAIDYGHSVVDAIFEHPRLAAIYDALDADRGDLEAYLAIVDEFDARHVLDVGCGTGTFAPLLAARGIEVTGVDPAGGSLDVARAKPGAARVHWIHGDAGNLPPLRADLATMTGNVAQAIADPTDWDTTLRGIHGPCGRAGVWCSKPEIRRTGPGWTGTARRHTGSPPSRVSAGWRAGPIWSRSAGRW